MPDLAPKCFVTEKVNSIGANFVVPSVVPLLCQNDCIQKTQLVAIESSNEVKDLKETPGKTEFLAEKSKRALPDSNRGITVLQTVALPLGEGPISIIILDQQDWGSTVPDDLCFSYSSMEGGYLQFSLRMFWGKEFPRTNLKD